MMQMFPKESAAPKGTARRNRASPARQAPHRGRSADRNQERGDALEKVTAERVLAELAQIAFADLGAEPAPPVKVGDKLRALEMLYKWLGLGEGAEQDTVVIVDEPPGQEVSS